MFETAGYLERLSVWKRCLSSEHRRGVLERLWDACAVRTEILCPAHATCENGADFAQCGAESPHMTLVGLQELLLKSCGGVALENTEVFVI